MKFLKIAIMALGIGVAGFAAAHSDEYLDTTKAPNGGQLRMAGAYHYELVIRPAGKDNANEVLVYVTDHGGKEISVAGATGTATILSNGKASVQLKPEGKNLMKGAGNFAASPDLKAVVSIGLAGHQPQQARFTPFATKVAESGHMHHQ
ncbi:hypothetical protein [Noviherbaspirillum sp. UKPF54]|uniref:hypothetical protein n=1 Tax=Noviherbaspirillum sp. UKPF54 TaxID=2601898 RepID=UPI0011B16433|nr:hypothetical protein [Noviherbaspirillum sp. UKPF54]QDZ29811.1 hypothetical protein FAY22_18680 [Noviherbaspirillum sp. UKPF54]